MAFIVNPDDPQAGSGAAPAPGPTHGPGPSAGNPIKDSDTRSFVADVIEASATVPVIVDFCFRRT